MRFASENFYFISNEFSSRENQKRYIMVCNSLFRLLQMQERSSLYSHVTWQSMLLQKQKCKSIIKVCLHA